MTDGGLALGKARLLAEQLVHVVYDSDSLALGIAAVQATRAAAVKLTDGPYAVVVDARAVGYVQQEAREWLATSPQYAPVAAAIVAEARIMRYLVDLQAPQTRVRPMAVFRTEQEAVAWAKEQLTQWRAANPDAESGH